MTTSITSGSGKRFRLVEETGVLFKLLGTEIDIRDLMYLVWHYVFFPVFIVGVFWLFARVIKNMFKEFLATLEATRK